MPPLCFASTCRCILIPPMKNIIQRVKRFAGEQWLTLLSLILLFIALSTLSAFFFAGEKKRANLFLEFKAEESAFALLDYYRQGIVQEAEELERILGFAFYGPHGSVTAAAGEYPRSIDIREMGDALSTIAVDYRGNTVSIIKRLGMVPTFMAPQQPMRMRGFGKMEQDSAMYVLISVPELLVSYRRYGILQIVLPLLLAVGLATVGFVLMRNWEYRKEIDSKRHLVHLGEAARTLSHEIKNPLSAIQIQAAILKKTLPEVAHNGVGVIEEEVHRLRLLSERIGEFLKNPKGDPRVLDAAAFVGELLEKLPWKIGFSSTSADPARVRVDSERFRSVVENLVKNAVESGANNPKVDVAVACDRGSVIITVSDNGAGIEHNNRERIFEPFFTTKEQGSGIGLAISRRFVEVAGGTLSLRPGNEGGTVAEVKLPRSRG